MASDRLPSVTVQAGGGGRVLDGAQDVATVERLATHSLEDERLRANPCDAFAAWRLRWMWSSAASAGRSGIVAQDSSVFVPRTVSVAASKSTSAQTIASASETRSAP
jgi:hypothetical protein